MKALAYARDPEVNAGRLQISFDLFLTTDGGTILQNGRPQSAGGNIPRQYLAFDGSATNLINAIEARAISVAAGLGVTIAAADCVIYGVVQGA